MNPISNPALIPPGAVGGSASPSAPASRPAAPAPGAARKPARADGAADRPAGAAGAGGSFTDALSRAHESSRLQFSKHALARVQRRGIELGANTLGRLAQGVDRAASKGSRDSLVLVDGTAFVVSVNNRTVITAVGSEHMKDNVFTNIDSAVIA
ncbi:MAG TPA: TIGR02530 family flagellar biosynthesis protein [Solirubrobacteraceae bacterium]|nr:TIGR02530 family flagellar biosynthesis protein [Solirubrobacteraceae bacterium]